MFGSESFEAETKTQSHMMILEGIVTTTICWRHKGVPNFPVFYEKFQNRQHIKKKTTGSSHLTALIKCSIRHICSWSPNSTDLYFWFLFFVICQQTKQGNLITYLQSLIIEPWFTQHCWFSGWLATVVMPENHPCAECECLIESILFPIDLFVCPHHAY